MTRASMALCLALSCASLIVVCSCTSTGSEPAASTPPRDRALEWMRTSAEYRALCRQVFRSAGNVLRKRLKTDPPANPAVVLDLDETVLDNMAFNVYLLLTDQTFSSGLWESWVASDAASLRLVPGARGFLDEFKDEVTLVFISNRESASAAATLRTLVRLGVVPKDTSLSEVLGRTLHLRGADKSKEGRREAVLGSYDVVLWIGDNLADFHQEYEPGTTTAGERVRLADLRDERRWGHDWFVLPNPVYGAWLDALGPAELEKMHAEGAWRPR